MASHYDDTNFSYTDYWQGRDYEHQCEVLAFKKLLRGKSFQNTADIGGGYGRLIPLLAEYSRHVTLIEPSIKQRKIAAKMLKFSHKKVSIQSGTTQKTNLKTASQDLITVVRVMHHLPNPLPSFKEINRVLKPDGWLILEFANSHNLKARIGSVISGQPLLPTPLERRSIANIKRKTIPFVNHAPATIIKQLKYSGFMVQQTLSVSNFRSPFLKQILPVNILLFLESHAQKLLTNNYLGPSIFLLCHKA